MATGLRVIPVEERDEILKNREIRFGTRYYCALMLPFAHNSAPGVDHFRAYPTRKKTKVMIVSPYKAALSDEDMSRDTFNFWEEIPPIYNTYCRSFICEFASASELTARMNQLLYAWIEEALPTELVRSRELSFNYKRWTDVRVQHYLKSARQGGLNYPFKQYFIRDFVALREELLAQ